MMWRVLGLQGAMVVFAARALAANTCGGFLSVDYSAAHEFSLPGDVVRVRLTFGAGSINGGTKLTVNRVRFDLDCDSTAPLGIGCTDEGAVIGYEGDGTIGSNCIVGGDIAVSFTTGHGTSGTPNQVVLTPNPPLQIPANTSEACFVEFDVRVLDHGSDPTPDAVEQVVGYSVASTDAQCDNGLLSAGSQSGAIVLCPPCDSGSCPGQTCNQSSGTCETVADDADGDGEIDRTDRCPGTAEGAAVDDSGCSLEQFCRAITLTSRESARACKKADWRNDEPLMKREEADCAVDKGERGPEDDRCVPAAP